MSSAPQAVIGGVAARALHAALNHLLAQNPWARDRLRGHAGRVVEIGVDPSARESVPAPLRGLAEALEPRMRATIADDGTLSALSLSPARESAEAGVATAAPAAVTLLVRPSIDALFAGLRAGPQGLARHLRIDGDVLLAGALGEIAAHARWDLEEDLSRVVGDAAAHRAGRTAREAAAGARAWRERTERAAVEFLSVEQPTLVTRRQWDACVAATGELESRVDALARRVLR